MELNVVTERIIGAAIDVHRALGPGPLESAYEACPCHELAQRQVAFERQRALPLEYRGLRLDCAYRFDLLVDGCVAVEIKAVAALEPIHEANEASNAWSKTD